MSLSPSLSSSSANKRHVVYTRVSTEDQAREGVSLAAQKDACLTLCKLRNLSNADAVEDAGFSAKSLKRPGITGILAAVEAGQVQTLVVWRLDRLTRNLRDLLDLVALFDRHKVALVSVMEQLDTGSPMGRLMLSMLGAVAQWERESIAERVKLGIHHRKAQGGFTGGHVPTATAVIGGPGTRKLIPDPQWGAIATQAWQRVTDGASLAQVAAWLTEQGVPPPRAGSKAKLHAWHKQNTQEWLTNPRLVGVLVERSVFEACRHTLSSRSSPKNPKGTSINKVALSDRVWPLQGVARCAYCGLALAGSVSYGRSGKPHYYLRCTNRLKAKGCTASDLSATIWEDAVIELLVKSAHGQGDLLLALEAEMKQQRLLEGPARERLGAITLQRDSIQQRLDRLIDLVASGDAPGKSVAPKIAELQLAIDECDRQRARCEAEIASASMTVANSELMLDHWRKHIAGLDQQSPEIKRQTIMAVLKEAHLGLGKDIRLVFWPLGSGGSDGGGGLARPHPTDPQQGPNATITNPSNKSTTVLGSDDGRLWRRGGDSNPRLSFPNAGFRNRCLQPLSHLSRSICGGDFLWWSRLVGRGYWVGRVQKSGRLKVRKSCV
jgi:site-specific DNA recombinase